MIDSIIFLRKTVLIPVILAIFFSQGINAQEKKWTLKNCIDTALQNNITVGQYANASKTSQVNLHQSMANLLPAINGNASQSFNSGRSLNPVSYQFINGNVWTNNFSLNGSVPLFTGLQNANIIKQNQLNYESSKYDVESVKFDITISVVNAYLQVLFASELVNNATNQVELANAQLDKVKQLLDAGTKAESDYLLLKADLANKKLLLVNAGGQLKTAKLNLQQLMNRTVEPDFDVEYPLPDEPDAPVLPGTPAVLSEALKIYPSVKASQLKTQSVVYAIKTARGVMLPRLLLNGSINTNYSSASKKIETSYLNSFQGIGYLQSNPSEVVVGNVPRQVYNTVKYPFDKQLNDNLYKSVSLSLAIPVFNSQTRFNVQKQKINLENAKLNEKAVENTLQKNIEKTYTDVENGLAKYNATKEQLAAITASFENARIKYEAQLISATDLLVEKNKFMQAQSENIQAKYELLLSSKILDLYMGKPINL